MWLYTAKFANKMVPYAKCYGVFVVNSDHAIYKLLQPPFTSFLSALGGTSTSSPVQTHLPDSAAANKDQIREMLQQLTELHTVTDSFPSETLRQLCYKLLFFDFQVLG